MESGSCTTTTELLWFHSSGVGNQQGSVVGSEDLLQLVLGGLVNVLGGVGDQTLGKSLSDGVNLGDVTTTGNLNSDIQAGKLVQADQ